ncbi:MAG: formate dehydrogenase [Syntrophomonadaceae bacterium]|nr:formate dehydrogenase [Syntrophomonadaceae bacterium]
MEPTFKKSDKIFRFTVGERVAHWSHAISFFILLFTGLGMISMFFRPAVGIVGGIDVARNIHRVVAVLFVVVFVVNLFIGEGGRNVRAWVREILAFDKKDLAHFMIFPFEFFGLHRPYPPQGKFNGGEKFNSALMITGMVCLVITGFMMWFPTAIPRVILQWAYPAHAGFALLLTAVLLAHLYLSLLHPDSNQALKGMFNGYVPAKFAYEHYEKWYYKVKSEENVKEQAKREIAADG